MSRRLLPENVASGSLRVASAITITVVGMIIAYLIVQMGLLGLNNGLNHLIASKATAAPSKQYFDTKTREIVGLVFALAVPVLGIRVLADEIFSRAFRSRRFR